MYEIIANTKTYLDAIADEIESSGNKVVASRGEELYKLITTEGKKPTYPIRWDSEKQRRAFFATGGFGGGIPYNRTQAYIRSWKYTQQKGEFSLATAYPKAIYIGGDELGNVYSGIHVSRWTNIYSASMEAARNISLDIADRIQSILKKHLEGGAYG